MAVFKTHGFLGNAVQFSPFLQHRLAVATTQNSDVDIGIGRQYVLEITSRGVEEVCSFFTSVGLHDCAFSQEQDNNILVSGCGDGSLKMWNIDVPLQSNPVRTFNEHSCGVYSVQWNTLQQDCFLSGSWDHTIKLWKADRLLSVSTYHEESCNIFGINRWCPKHAHLFLSAVGGSNVSIFDLRVSNNACLIIPADGEVIACDWSNFVETMICTGSTDQTVKLWDIRFPEVHVKLVGDLDDGVRHVRFSNHEENVLVCSSGKSVHKWEYSDPDAPASLIHHSSRHSDFISGLDISKLVEGLLASTAWDESVIVWQPGIDPSGAFQNLGGVF